METGGLVFSTPEFLNPSIDITILNFESIDSTNLEAANQAKRGAKEGLCVVAESQTAGRGRHGRTWISPKNAGLYLSIVLRPAIEIRYLPLLTFAGAIAVYDCLRTNFSLSPDIKWANDVLVGEKKIAGILAETADSEYGMAVVLGIGINLRLNAISPELSETATSIENETGSPPDKQTVLQSLIGEFSSRYAGLHLPNGIEKTCGEWIERSSYANGKEVRAALPDRTISGRTSGITETGALKIETADEGLVIIQAGDVTRIRKNPSVISQD